MEVILRLLTELRLVLIAVAAICCAAFAFTGLSSLRELRRAVFRLERSAIMQRAIGAWIRAGICAIIGIAIWIATDSVPDTSSTVADNPLSVTPTPELPAIEPTLIPTADLSDAVVQMTASPIEAAPTADLNVAPAAAPPAPPPAPPTLPPTPIAVVVATPAPVLPQPTATLVPLPTATPPVILNPTLPPPPPPPTVAPTATPAPAVPTPEILVADCPNPAARIDSPVAGETVSGVYVVRGTADFPGGVGRYKLEILRPNIPGWAFLWENYNAVKNGVLMPRFDATLFPPGIYTLRLMLVDAAGQETNIYCSVQIKIA